MNWNLCLSICLMQIFLYTNAMENRDEAIELLLQTYLPYSVKKGEVISVPLMVHNRQHYKIPVTITLDNIKAEYEFMDFDNKVISKPNMTKSFKLEKYAAATVSFLIRPKVVGNVTLHFEAFSSSDFSLLKKTLNVVPEGITQFVTEAFVVHSKKELVQKTEIELESFEDLVPDSLHLEVGAVGDILGLVLKHLDNLAEFPTGCGEQTISSLLPSYLVMKYLKYSNRFTDKLEALRHNLESGYKNLLNCRLKDGSFSSFSLSQYSDDIPEGSLFVTSYILRFLPHFKEFIDVNETVIKEGLAYLSKKQLEDGRFPEKGIYYYPSQINFVTLTGAAVLAFLENHVYAEEYSQIIAKGLVYMSKNLENYKYLHTHALATYAFKHVNYAASEKTSLIKWLSVTNIETQSKFWHNLYLTNFERTSFNLLKIFELKTTKFNDMLHAVKWLLHNRISLSNFPWIKDSVAGLIDIIYLAEFDGYEPAKMDVNVLSKNKNDTVKLAEDNAILYESVDFAPDTKSAKTAANGTGSALIQFAFQYNTFKDQTRFEPSFNMSIVKLNNRARPSYLTMFVCAKYVGKEEFSNMAIMEIYTPSGYVVLDANLRETEKSKRIIHMESKNSGTLLVTYFDLLIKNVKVCLRVEAMRAKNVAMQKPVPIIIYEYSDKERRAVAFYNVDTKLCDICSTREECRKCK